MDLADLDAALLSAHHLNDREALVALYQKAGQTCLSQNQVDAGCFYLTHAYIYALEQGQAEAADIHALLVLHGREE